MQGEPNRGLRFRRRSSPRARLGGIGPTFTWVVGWRRSSAGCVRTSGKRLPPSMPLRDRWGSLGWIRVCHRASRAGGL